MKSPSPLSRRSFLSTSLAASGLTILRPGTLRAGNSPNDKLNLAIIGVGGRGQANIRGVKARPGAGLVQTDLTGMRGENIVALCDVDDVTLRKAAKEFPAATLYTDWRRCLDHKGLDAVVCSTPDHSHAFINIWAMNRGLGVYCEKPLANSVEEARMVRETYLKNRGKLATQMGTQMHSTDNFRRTVELIRRGAIGKPKEVRVWCGRRPVGGSYLPEAGPPPATLNWDLWIGPSPFHPYNPDYVGGCLKWNRFWDFGSGQIGDMGSHMLDLAYWALDLGFPTACQAKGSDPSPDTCPVWLTAEWDHPANGWRPAVKVFWYDGGKKPGMPSKIFHQARESDDVGDGVHNVEQRDPLFKGLLFTGDQGWLLADYNLRVLIPKDDNSDLSYFSPGERIPSSPGHHDEWIAACKNGGTTGSNFDYAGKLIEHNLLALVAYRTGQKLEWDASKLTATNCPEAEPFIRRKYRKGWTLNG